jgi:hypothetical protein
MWLYLACALALVPLAHGFWELQAPQLVSSAPRLPLWSLQALVLDLLPANVSAAALEGPSALFPFRAAPSALDASLTLPPEAAAVHLQPPALLLRLEAAASSFSSSTPSGNFTYYSAQMAQARQGRVERAVASPVGRALAAHAAALSAPSAAAAAAAAAAAVQVNVWLASSAACTPLHYDATVNLFTQLLGSKVVTLYPPQAATAAQLLPHASALQRSALAGLDGRAAAGAPLGGHAALTFALSAGQSLLIPAFWLHHVCSGPGSASASASAWRETPQQLAGRALLTLPLPLPPHWGRSWQVAGCLHLLRMLLPQPRTRAAAAAALRSRFAAPQLAAAPAAAAPLPQGLCGEQLPGAAFAELQLPPTQAAGSSVAEGGRVAEWLRKARAALAAQGSSAVRALAAANWVESALLGALMHPRLGGSRAGRENATEQAALLPLVVLHCLGD